MVRTRSGKLKGGRVKCQDVRWVIHVDLEITQQDGGAWGGMEECK